MMSLTTEKLEDKKIDKKLDIKPEVRDGDKFADEILADLGEIAVSETLDLELLEDIPEDEL